MPWIRVRITLATGIRTPVLWVKAIYPNRLDDSESGDVTRSAYVVDIVADNTTSSIYEL